MKSKSQFTGSVFILLSATLLAACAKPVGQHSEDQQYELLGEQKADRTLKVDRKQLENNVENAFSKSSPEVQEALIRAAKKMRAEGKLNDSSLPEKLEDSVKGSR